MPARTLGFTEVYDYVPGKLDWLAHNLSIEGGQADAATVGTVARDDVVTCGLNDRVGPVRSQIEATAYPFALVTAPAGVLLGRLRGSSLDCDPNLRAEEVMEPGPSTVRANTPAGQLAKRLADKSLRSAIVTTPEGVLIGVASRQNLERS